MRSILQPDARLARGAKPSMDEEFLIEALRLMLLSRLYDERVIGLQRQGRFGVYSPGLGH
jgi:TPP-dependent pyruvate/acetoin dehydrogenase alpha subunit